jgi:NAD(P)H-dependent FMN reductase
MPSKNPEALRWQKTLARYDGFVFVVAEYNSSVTGVLKNALDQAYKEWVRKPFTAIGYGGAGAARAIEHLRQITSALQMVSTANTVNIGGGDFMSTSPMGANKPIEDIEAHLQGKTKAALDELVWWAHATMTAKAAESSSRRDPNELAA